MVPVLEAIVFAVIVVLVLFSLYCRTRGCAVEDIVKRAPDIEINMTTIVPSASTSSPNIEVIRELRSYSSSRKARVFTAEEIERILGDVFEQFHATSREGR